MSVLNKARAKVTAPAPRGGAAAGFSLIELLVAMTIGILALLFVTRISINSEMAKQSSIGGSDSMQNGMVALFSITRDAGHAGWGMNDVLLAGCDTVFYDKGSSGEASGFVLATSTLTAGGASVTVSPLAPAVIVANASGSDQLSLYSGSSTSGAGTLRLTDNYSSGDSIKVDRVPYGFALNDVIAVVPETPGSAKCAISQITTAPGTAASLSFTANSTARFTNGSLGATYDKQLSRLFNLGPASSLSLHTWSVDKGFLKLRATDMAGASLVPNTVSDNVVLLKAQYGFDTRSGAAFDPTTGVQVLRWSPTMIDADGDGTVGGPGDYQRIAALRVAVVVRSKNPEKPDAATGNCTASSAATLPAIFGAAEPNGVAAVPITGYSVAVTGDPISWTCYRYRTFETIVPLRNAGWRPV